ncbi:MAG: hypothetical protein LRZ88_03920 [Candidatus Cloacimonetes bacterium]|nr:hypothetical protein [Candidatus Cloacimonadota bacterium]
MKIWKSLVLLMLLANLSSCAFARNNMFTEPNPVVKVVRDVREAACKSAWKPVCLCRAEIPFFDDDIFRFFFSPTPAATLGNLDGQRIYL